MLGRRNTETAIDEEEVRELGDVLTTVPDGLAIHKTLQRVIDAKKEMFERAKASTWATAEALAFGSLVDEGTASPVRARTAAAARSASATRSGSTRRPARNTFR